MQPNIDRSRGEKEKVMVHMGALALRWSDRNLMTVYIKRNGIGCRPGMCPSVDNPRFLLDFSERGLKKIAMPLIVTARR